MMTRNRFFRSCKRPFHYLPAGLLLLLPACRAAKPFDYQDEAGVHFAPPPGWVERDRPALQSATNRLTHGESNLPFPPLDSAYRERLLVRYDRLSSGEHAWMRLTIMALPPAIRLEDYLARRKPQADWRRDGEVEPIEVNGKPASRLAWKGRWLRKDYLCEIVAVRRSEAIYFFTASLPSDDTTAREQMRQAIANAVVP